MKRADMNWKKFNVILWFFISLGIVGGCSKEDKTKSRQFSASFADSSIVALVNGDPIHYDEVDKAIKQFLNQLGKDVDQFKQQTPDTSLWKEVLDWIVSIRLLAQEAQKQNINVDKNEIDLAINAIKRRFPSEQTFIDALNEADLTIEQFTENITKELMVQKLLEQQLKPQLQEISDEDALQYYNAHGEEFMQNEQIRVHHILLKVSETASPERVKNVENKARRILNRIRNGEDFEELARQYSEDPSALKGGDIGFFSRGELIDNFEQAALNLKQGEVSDLVRTALGFHIIRMDERKASQKVPFEQVKIEIKIKLKQQRSNTAFEQYVAKLKSDADIKIRGAA